MEYEPPEKGSYSKDLVQEAIRKDYDLTDDSKLFQIRLIILSSILKDTVSVFSFLPTECFFDRLELVLSDQGTKERCCFLGCCSLSFEACNQSLQSVLFIECRRRFKSGSVDMEGIILNINWEDVTCPICLDSPHNGVLLQCSSYEKGCQPFICDTDHTHSNCLERFKSAYGMSAVAVMSSATDRSGDIIQVIPSSPNSRPTCPLCRGYVTGWVVIDEARMHLNMKKRCCEEKHCSYVGSFVELQMHAKLKHPHSRPSAIDPEQQLDWENFQQSSEIIDVLSTIHAEVPHGVVLGDYVIEYGDDGTGDELEDFPRNGGNWWSSCMLYHVFDNLRASRNRRRLRARERRRVHRQSSSEGSNLDEGSPASADSAEYQFDETDDQPARSGPAANVAAGPRRFPHSYRRSRSLFSDH